MVSSSFLSSASSAKLSTPEVTETLLELVVVGLAIGVDGRFAGVETGSLIISIGGGMIGVLFS